MRDLLRRAGACLSAVLLVLAAVAAAGCGDEPVDPRAAAFVAEMEAAFERGDLRATLALADSAERYAPGLPAAGYRRGLVYNRLRQYDETRRALTAVLERDPDFPGAAYHLGHTAFVQEAYREALRRYEQERALLTRLQRSGDAAAADLQALPTVTAQIGRTYERLGLPDSARLAYEAALAADSTLAVAHAWLSELDEKEGRLEEAFHHARKAVHARPQDTEYTYRLGTLYLQLGYPEAAVPFLSIVAQRWPGHEGAAYNLGRALAALGREEESQLFLDRVDTLQRLQEETLMAERAVVTYPDDPRRWVTLAGLMLRGGYLDRAEEAFLAALTLRPGDLAVQNDLANVALARGDTAAAVQRFEAVLRQDSTFAGAWLNLGIIHALRGRPDAARDAWHRTLRYQPDDPQAKAYLAGLEQH